MQTLRLLLWFSSLITMIYTKKTNMSALNDPIEIIKLYLTHSEQGQSRLINREFNKRINKSHSTMKRQLERLSTYIEQVFGAADTSDETRERAMRELQVVEDSLALNEVYIKAWPRLLEKCISRCNSSLSAKAGHKVASWYRYRHFQDLNMTNFHELDTVTKLLVYSSRMMWFVCCIFYFWKLIHIRCLLPLTTYQSKHALRQ